MDECWNCKHPPIRHIQDGLGWTCLVCLLLMREGQTNRVCTTPMKFKLSQSTREQAARASKDSYLPHTICAICNCEWQQHMGYLCPSGDSVFIPLLDKDLPFIKVN